MLIKVCQLFRRFLIYYLIECMTNMCIDNQDQIEFKGPERFNNNDFMSQFHDIYYTGAADSVMAKEANTKTSFSQGPGSMGALQLAMVEDKIKEYVIQELKNLKSSMQASQNKALKNLQKKNLNAAKRMEKGLDRKIKETDSVMRLNLRASNLMESSRVLGSGTNSVIFDSVQPAGAAPGHNIISTKLIEDIQEAVAAETLN